MTTKEVIEFVASLKVEYILLLGPFVFYFSKSCWQYRGNTISEFLNGKAIKIGALSLLVVHLFLLYFYGLEWFCSTDGYRNPGPVATQFFPGIGYSFLFFSYAVSNRVFDSEGEKRAERNVKLMGLLAIIGGYLHILNYKL